MSIKLVPLSPINFHIYQCLKNSGGPTLDELVQKAFDTVQNLPYYEETDGSVRMSVRPRLAEILQDELLNRFSLWSLAVSDGIFSSDDEAEFLNDPDEKFSSPIGLTELFVPLACAALGQVDTYAIAEAILREKGNLAQARRSSRSDLTTPGNLNKS